MTEKKYHGVVVPAVTPLTKELQLDSAALARMFELFRREKVTPFILGTTGEAPSFSLEFKKELLLAAGRLKQPGDQLYAGISSNCFTESVTLAQWAFDHGADVVVATLPSYYSLSETAMLRYFEELAEEVAGPLMVYNIPATTHMSLPLDVIEQLSHHPFIVGLKDSERNQERLLESLARWRGRRDFSHLLGWAAQSAEALEQGCDGLVPSTGNFAPGLYAQLYAEAKKGNKEEARRLQERSDTLGDLYQKGKSLGESLWALKVVMNACGLCEPYVMPPLVEGLSSEAARLRQQFQELTKEDVLKEQA